MAKLHYTPRGNTRTGIWSLIDYWLEKLMSAERRRERAEARNREEAAARERVRRENATSKMADRTAAAFDRKMIQRRKAQ